MKISDEQLTEYLHTNGPINFSAMASDLLEARAEVERLRERVGQATRYDLGDVVVERTTTWPTKEPHSAWYVWRRGSDMMDNPESLTSAGAWDRRDSNGAEFPTADLAFSALAKATVSK